MLTYYTTDDLRAPEPSLTISLMRLDDAIQAYKALPASRVRALGVREGDVSIDLVRCLPVLPRDQVGEDVMVLEFLEYPMWKSRPTVMHAAQVLASRLMIRYCLFKGCVLPVPTADTLPKTLRNRYLWPTVPGRPETAIHWLEVAGVGRLSLAEFKRRYRKQDSAFSFPLVLHVGAHGQDHKKRFRPLEVTPWEFHLLAHLPGQAPSHTK